MACPYEQSEDGVELQFATNFLGHFLLTNLLIEKVIKAEKGMRIVNVSSWGHAFGLVRFDDINFQVYTVVTIYKGILADDIRMGRSMMHGKRMDNLSLQSFSEPMRSLRGWRNMEDLHSLFILGVGTL
jgi:hypothetical protein